MTKNLFVLLFFIFFTVYARMDIDKRGKWLNVLPFGIGQYQNYEEGKALIFLGTESVFLGTSLGFAIAGKNRNVELYSFLAFLASYCWGVFDAFNNYNKIDEKIIKGMEKPVTFAPIFRDRNFGLTMLIRF